MSSTSLPGLADICGERMIVHLRRRAIDAGVVDIALLGVDTLEDFARG